MFIGGDARADSDPNFLLVSIDGFIGEGVGLFGFEVVEGSEVVFLGKGKNGLFGPNGFEVAFCHGEIYYIKNRSLTEAEKVGKE